MNLSMIYAMARHIRIGGARSERTLHEPGYTTPERDAVEVREKDGFRQWRFVPCPRGVARKLRRNGR